jgi:hypothetical protein
VSQIWVSELLIFLKEIDEGLIDGIIDDFQYSHSKPMDQWENEEVLEFIVNEVSMKFGNISTDSLARFQCISGYIFRTLTEDNCKILSNSNYIGEMIFNAKEKYIRYHPSECKIGQRTLYTGPVAIFPLWIVDIFVTIIYDYYGNN